MINVTASFFFDLNNNNCSPNESEFDLFNAGFEPHQFISNLLDLLDCKCGHPPKDVHNCGECPRCQTCVSVPTWKSVI